MEATLLHTLELLKKNDVDEAIRWLNVAIRIRQAYVKSGIPQEIDLGVGAPSHLWVP